MSRTSISYLCSNLFSLIDSSGTGAMIDRPVFR